MQIHLLKIRARSCLLGLPDPRTEMDVHLNNLFSRYQEQFGSGPGLGPGSGTCLLKIDGISTSFIKSLYKAAASLYRTDLWRRLRPGHLFGIRVGKDWDWYGRKQPYTCLQLIGGDGGDLGIHIFRSKNDANKMTGSRETIRVPNVELMRVTYEVESLMLPSNKRLIRSLGLEKSGEDRFAVFDVARCTLSGGLEFRNPSFEELRFVYAVLRAVGLVHPLLEQDFGAGPKYSRVAWFKPFIETVDVHWPVEMSKENEIVAVTVSHPPNQGYDEKSSSASSTPTKNSEYKEESF